MNKNIKAFIFDLDGVITDTAEYHYLAWKELANSLNIDFDRETNEQLKGISRVGSLELILEKGGYAERFSEKEKEILATRKNEYYKQLIENISVSDILPGIIEILKKVKKNGLRVALASASKNAPIILGKLQLESFFDVIVNVEEIKNGKPDPEIFLKAAELLGVLAEECIGVEDAAAGVQAIKSANMFAVGVGSKTILNKADLVVSTTKDLLYEDIIKSYMQS